MSKIALLPGGFKPPHAGHYNMAKWLSANTGADKTIIFVGPKERDGITQEMSLKLWKIYIQNDSGLEVRPAGVSPVRDVYDFVEQDAPEGSTVFLGMGEKDISDKRFANIPKFAEPRGIKFETKLVPPQAGGVSGTQMRGFIKDNDKANFQYYLPDHLSNEQKEQAWDTVTGLDEDLYNPEDKVLDYMRSSVPGPKDDIPRAYRYKRGGLYTGGGMGFGGMYEDAQFEKGKVLHVYDFDDTIAKVKANIRTIITSPTDPDFFQELDIASTEFPEKSKELETRLGHLDITYDFGEFEKQINNAIVNSKVVSKLKNSLSRPDIKTTILTARSIGHPVTRYLKKDLGLDAYVVPLGMQVDGKVRGIDKANWIENHIKKGYQTIYFIDDSEENRVAVASLKDKYPDIILKVEDPAAVSEMMMGMMTKQEKAKHAKNMKRLKKDMSKMRGNNYGGGGYKVPDYVKGTLTRKYYEEMSSADLDSVENYADNKLDPIDIEFTNHFFDRLNDPRNDKEISSAELIGFFKRLSKNKKAFIEFLKTYKEVVATDNRTNLNIPFVNQANKAIAKTVMRKKDFQTSNPQLDLERKLTKGELKDRERIAQDLPDKEFKKRYGKDWKSVKLATATKLAKKEGMYPPYKADQVQKVRYQASDTFTNSPKQAKKRGYLEEIGIDLSNYKGQILPGDVLRAPKGFPLGGKKLEKSIQLKVIKNSREGVNRYKLSLEDKDGKKYTVRNFQMDGEYKGKKLPKWGLVRKSRKNINEGDPKKGTGKKPKGSGRRLYTDEDPSDTVKVKFSTRQDIVDTLSKKSFKAKSHARKSQIINLIHQRVRAALSRTKDPKKKAKLRSGFEYIKKRKEASKRKTKRMRKEAALTKNWWKEIINEILLTEGGAAGHMAHPFNLPNVNNGKQLLDVFKKSADSLDKNPGAVKIDGVNSSIRLVDLDGKKQFVMDRGSKKELDIKGITKDDLLSRFGDGHGMVKVGGEVLDMFNEALPELENDLKKLGAYDNPNILFNMEYVSGKTNVQDYGSNFIAIHGLNKIESKEVQGKRKMLTKRISSEISYDKNALDSLLKNLEPIAKKRGYEVYGSVPTKMTKKPNFNAALSKNYTVNAGENSETKSLGQWLNTLSNIPETDFIFMNVGYKQDSSTINRKKVGAVSKQVYLAILNGDNVDGLFEKYEDKEKAIQGFVTYLATEKLGDEVLKVLDSPMGSVENHEGVVIRDNSIANVPFKITGKFILGGLASDF